MVPAIGSHPAWSAGASLRAALDLPAATVAVCRVSNRVGAGRDRRGGRCLTCPRSHRPQRLPPGLLGLLPAGFFRGPLHRPALLPGHDR